MLLVLFICLSLSADSNTATIGVEFRVVGSYVLTFPTGVISTSTDEDGEISSTIKFPAQSRLVQRATRHNFNLIPGANVVAIRILILRVENDGWRVGRKRTDDRKRYEQPHLTVHFVTWTIFRGN